MTALGYKNVGWLDVAVNDALGVRCIECIGDIDAQFQQCVDIKRTLGHKVLQGRTLEQLHNYVRAAMFLSNVVYRADVWMVQSGGGPGLALKPLEHHAVLG